MTKILIIICWVIPAIILGDIMLAGAIKNAVGEGLSNAFLVLTLMAQFIAVLIHLMTNRLGGK